MKAFLPFGARWLFLALAVLPSARADVTPAPLFCDHAVLQQGMSVPVWGSAAPDEEVKVSYAGQSLTTTADAQGKWMVRLKPLRGGESGVMHISGKNSLTFEDVVVGEVWFCAGQSNMALTLRAVADSAHEIAEANHPEIRQYHVPQKASDQPEDFAFNKASWKVCTSEHVLEYSATAYFFAREISRTLGVPVGIINSSWGGVPIHPWIDAPVFAEAEPALYAKLLARRRSEIEHWPPIQAKWDKELAQWQGEADQAKVQGVAFTKPKPSHNNPSLPQSGIGGIGNGMLHPLLPYAIRGALWYQGETNAESGPSGAADYALMQPLMVRNWRALWGEGDFPFYFVQLPNHQLSAKADPSSDSWAYFREAQTQALAATPKAGMAVTIDIGQSDSLHPRDKQDVGHRLALIAEANTYGKAVAWASPMYRSMKIEDGGKVRIEFDHAAGLNVKGGGELANFTIAGADKRFVPATARLEADDVIVSSPDVPTPVAVRYAWADDPQGINLYNKAGLPAAPFRTDTETK